MGGNEQDGAGLVALICGHTPPFIFFLLHSWEGGSACRDPNRCIGKVKAFSRLRDLSFPYPKGPLQLSSTVGCNMYLYDMHVSRRGNYLDRVQITIFKRMRRYWQKPLEKISLWNNRLVIMEVFPYLLNIRKPSQKTSLSSISRAAFVIFLSNISSVGFKQFLLCSLSVNDRCLF